MLSIPPGSRIFVCREAVDTRKSFDGLAAAAQARLGQEPSSGAYFVFVSRRRKLLKILRWEGDGYAIWSKRLERGQSSLPAPGASPALLDLRELHMVLDGIRSARFYRRYHNP